MLFGYARSWCHQNIHDISGVTATTILSVLQATLTLLLCYSSLATEMIDSFVMHFYQAGQKYSLHGSCFEQSCA
jgi:hypothetical protein